MHSITMSPCQSFQRSPPLSPVFSSFNSAAITIEIDEVYRCDDSGCLFPFAILQSDNAKTCVDSCCTIIKRVKQELVQPRPYFGNLVFHAGGLPHHPLLTSIVSSKCRPPFAQFQVSTQVLGLVLPTCWVQHSHNGPNSPLSTLLLTWVWPPNIFYSPRLGSHVGMPSTAAAGNDFALLGCITPSRCCWQACTVSIDGLHISYYSSRQILMYLQCLWHRS